MSKYDDTIEIIKNLPMTWYPALLKIMVEAAYAKSVFVPGGATKVVRDIEMQIIGGAIKSYAVALADNDPDTAKVIRKKFEGEEFTAFADALDELYKNLNKKK